MLALGLLSSSLLAIPTASEHAVRPGLRHGVGMQHTPMAIAGDKSSLRVAIQSDFFVQQNFFCCSGPTSDAHRRYRTFFNVGWTPFSWMELQLGLEHGVNRNDRVQQGRQDPVQVYSMGDTRAGLKLLAPWWTQVLRVGIQQELQILSGPGEGARGRLRYGADLLVSALLHRAPKKLPLRVATSVGVFIDRSHQMYDWSDFGDPVSQEVFRFGVGSHQDRLRSRLGLDAPLRLGRHHWGLTPMLELQWDRSFSAVKGFHNPSTKQSGPSRQKSAVQASAGLALHPVPQFFIDLGYQITLLQPGFAYGPKSAPWQISISVGGSFSLRPNRSKRLATPHVQPQTSDRSL